MASSSNPYQHYGNPTVDDEDDLIDPDNATLDDLDDPLQQAGRAPLTGNITANAPSSSSNPIASSYLTSRIPGEDRRAATSTIDESVWDTLRRDLLAIWSKLLLVLYPKHLFGGSMLENTSSLRSAYENLREAGISGVREEVVGFAGRALDADALLVEGGNKALSEWDLWGPLVFCLLLAALLSFRAMEKQREMVFSGVFVLVWLGEALVTLQIKLLGGNISFAQSICIIGYTLFPLVLAAMLSAVGIPMLARIPVYLFLIGWSLAAGVSILGGSGVVKNRVGIAVYPLFVFYLGLGCLCFIS